MMTIPPIENVRHSRARLVSLLAASGVSIGSDGTASACPLCGSEHFAAVWQRPGGGWQFRCNACAVDLDIVSLQSRLRSMTTLAATLRGME